MARMRIGQAIDIHPLESGRPLVLGGVEIDSPKGLKGHSDADVLLHAIAESILRALALGDLGANFPDTDPKYKGIASTLLLDEVYRKMREKNIISATSTRQSWPKSRIWPAIRRR